MSIKPYHKGHKTRSSRELNAPTCYICRKPFRRVSEIKAHVNLDHLPVATVRRTSEVAETSISSTNVEDGGPIEVTRSDPASGRVSGSEACAAPTNCTVKEQTTEAHEPTRIVSTNIWDPIPQPMPPADDVGESGRLTENGTLARRCFGEVTPKRPKLLRPSSHSTPSPPLATIVSADRSGQLCSPGPPSPAHERGKSTSGSDGSPQSSPLRLKGRFSSVGEPDTSVDGLNVLGFNIPFDLLMPQW